MSTSIWDRKLDLEAALGNHHCPGLGRWRLHQTKRGERMDDTRQHVLVRSSTEPGKTTFPFSLWHRSGNKYIHISLIIRARRSSPRSLLTATVSNAQHITSPSLSLLFEINQFAMNPNEMKPI